LPSGRWALTPPFHPCQALRNCQWQFLRASALDRNRQVRGFSENLPPRCKLTGGLIFCGTFRSRRKILRSCQWQLRRAPYDEPPGVTRRVALLWPSLASSPQLESGLSSRPDKSGPAITRLTRSSDYTPHFASPSPLCRQIKRA
jgi:hypothetical protein